MSTDKNAQGGAGKKAQAREGGMGVLVRSLSKAGFRRIGRTFTSEGTKIPISDLTEQEIEILKNEPRLSLMPVDLDSTDGKAE